MAKPTRSLPDVDMSDDNYTFNVIIKPKLSFIISKSELYFQVHAWRRDYLAHDSDPFLHENIEAFKRHSAGLNYAFNHTLLDYE